MTLLTGNSYQIPCLLLLYFYVGPGQRAPVGPWRSSACEEEQWDVAGFGQREVYMAVGGTFCDNVIKICDWKCFRKCLESPKTEKEQGRPGWALWKWGPGSSKALGLCWSGLLPKRLPWHSLVLVLLFGLFLPLAKMSAEWREVLKGQFSAYKIILTWLTEHHR